MRDLPIKYGSKGAYVGGSCCGCGKTAWDKRGAQTKRNELLKRGNERDLRVYQCPISNLWHLTKKV